MTSYAYDEAAMLEGIRRAQAEGYEQPDICGGPKVGPNAARPAGEHDVLGAKHSASDVPASVARSFGMTVAELRGAGPESGRSSVHARWACVWLWRQRGCSFSWIGRQLKMHHTSAMHGALRLGQMMDSDPELRTRMEGLERGLGWSITEEQLVWEPEELAAAFKGNLAAGLRELAGALERGELEGHYMGGGVHGFGVGAGEMGMDVVLRLRVPMRQTRVIERPLAQGRGKTA